MLSKPIVPCGFATATVVRLCLTGVASSMTDRGYASKICEAQPQVKTSGYILGKPEAYRTVLRLSRQTVSGEIHSSSAVISF